MNTPWPLLLQELASQAQLVAALQAEMAALSEAAAQRDEELKKYRAQLVKAKQRRQLDADKCV